MLKKILNKKEAMEYLGLSRYAIDAAIKSGSLRYKTVGRRLMFPIWALDEWLKNTIKHIDCTAAAQHGMPIFHSCQETVKKYSLEALWAQQTEQKLNALLLKKLPWNK